MSTADIRAALVLGDAQFALAELRGLLESAEHGGRDDLAEWPALRERAGRMLGGPAFAETVRRRHATRRAYQRARHRTA